MRRVFLFGGLGCAMVFLAACGTPTSGKHGGAQVLTNEEFRKLDCAAENVPPPGMEGAVEKGSETGVEVSEQSATNKTAAASSKARLIAPGAQLTVYVQEDPSLNRQYIVPYSGWVDFPPLGRLTVVGLSGEEVAANIKTGLEKDYFRQATVEVTVEFHVQTGSGVIYVLGRVGRPGPIAIPTDGSFTLTKAMLASGGGDAFADRKRVQIIRYCQDGRKYKTFVNVAKIMDEGQFEDDVSLRDGDWILVGERLINLW